MSEAITCDRRRFLGIAALTMAGAEFGMLGAAHALRSGCIAR